MNGYTHRPETALDDLIADQAMDNRITLDFRAMRRAIRAAHDDGPEPRWCNQCGGYQRHHVMCPNRED